MMHIGKLEIDRMLEPRGKRKPETLWTIARRDRLLRMAARCHFAGLSERKAAEEIAARLDQYRNRGSWRRDRLERACPNRHDGRLEEILFALLKVRDASISVGTCRRALSAIREPRARG